MSTSLGAACALVSTTAMAQLPGTEELAAGLFPAEMTWTGQRVAHPSYGPRPEASLAARGVSEAVSVHRSAGVAVHEVDATLVAFERAALLLRLHGWALPPDDGGRGGDGGFDVYLRPTLEPTDTTPSAPCHEVRFDAPWLGLEPLDGALVHVVARADVPDDRRLACAIEATLAASLAAHDPAEASAARVATGAFVAGVIDGAPGANELAWSFANAHPERGVFVGRGEAGALWLYEVSKRHDEGSDRFVREHWSGARQRTADDGDLRGEPDVMNALAQGLVLASDAIERRVEDLAVTRFLALPDAEGRRTLPLPFALPWGARPAPYGETSWRRLPRQLTFRGDEDGGYGLAEWGSAYAMIELAEAPVPGQLRVWVHGEFGTEWALTIVRLDAEGRELGRTRAPRRREPTAFVPLELTGGEARALVVVTSLPRGRPDLDVPNDLVRSFRLVVDDGDGATTTP